MQLPPGELWILVEYCRYGNLLSFLHRNKCFFVDQRHPATGAIDINKLVSDTPFSAGTLSRWGLIAGREYSCVQ